MTTENQASAEVVKSEPTLASVRQEKADQKAAMEKLHAELKEGERIRAKKRAIEQALLMQADIEKIYANVKAQKKLLKGLLLDLKALDGDEDLNVEQIDDLITRGVEATTIDPFEGIFHSGGFVGVDHSKKISVIKNRDASPMSFFISPARLAV